MNKPLFLSTFLVIALASGCAQHSQTDSVVTIKTKYGDMVAILYDETPKHKANFIKLAKEHYYDSLLFHRVIEQFMIQGGDPDSKNAQPGQPLGRGGPEYTIDAEFNPNLFHEKGALSAARLGDEQNPMKSSSGSQFYIVQGRTYAPQELTQLETNIQYGKKSQYIREVLGMPQYASIRQMVIEKQQAQDGQWLNSFFENADTLIAKAKPDYKPVKFSEAQIKLYSEIGGAPHLDGDYTVFGRVIKGLEVIDAIAAAPKDQADRPMEDIRISMTVEELPRQEITKRYGYEYPKK